MQDKHEKLERLIDSTLRGQPLLRAPARLESRVLAELARRAALPWWQRSFVHWPFVAKALFIVACAGFMKLALEGITWLFAAAQAPAASMRETATIAASIGEVGTLLFNALPSQWLYLAIALGGGLYLALFGLGATAYRTLYK